MGEGAPRRQVAEVAVERRFNEETVCTYVRKCVCAYVRMCVCAYVRMCVCAYVLRARGRFYSEPKCLGGRNPRGFVAAGKPLFRSGCTVRWHSSKNLMEWEISFPQLLPIAV